MMVNGVPRWTCRTHVDRVLERRRVRDAPLRNLPVIRDLVTDMREFFDKWARAKGEFRGRQTKQDDFAKVPPQSEERVLVDKGIECIGCAVCYAACDVVKWNPDYLGPAALNRAWTLVKDVRDRSNARAAARGLGRRRLPRLPQPRELHRALPEASFSDRRDRRAEARGGEGGPAGRALSYQRRSRLCGWRSARAPACSRSASSVHLVTIIYAVQGGLTAAEILGAHARQRRLVRLLFASSCSP